MYTNDKTAFKARVEDTVRLSFGGEQAPDSASPQAGCTIM